MKLARERMGIGVRDLLMERRSKRRNKPTSCHSRLWKTANKSKPMTPELRAKIREVVRKALQK